MTGPNFGSNTDFSGLCDTSTEIDEEEWSSSAWDIDDTRSTLFGSMLSGCPRTIWDSIPNRLTYSVWQRDSFAWFFNRSRSEGWIHRRRQTGWHRYQPSNMIPLCSMQWKQKILNSNFFYPYYNYLIMMQAVPLLMIKHCHFILFIEQMLHIVAKQCMTWDMTTDNNSVTEILILLAVILQVTQHTD